MKRPVLAGLAVAALLLSGCAAEVEPPTPPVGVDLSTADPADGSGLWLRSGPAVTAIVAEAMRAAGPVHVTGSITEMVQPDPEEDAVPGRTITFDFHGTAAAYTATVTAGDVAIEAVVTIDGSRLRGNAGFARQYPGREAGAVMCTTGLDGALADWAPLLDPAALVSTLLAGDAVGASAPTGDTDTIDVVAGEEGSVTGVLVVERFGPPLPRSFVAADASGDGELVFAGWGEPADLDAAAATLPCPAP